MIYQDTGYMVKQTNYSESSKIITILNEHGAIVPLMARGFNKLKSPFIPLRQGMKKVLFTYTRHRGMGTLTEVDVINPYHTINNHFDLYTSASYVTEVITRITDETLPDLSLYRLMYQSFFLLDDKNERYSVMSFALIKLFPKYGVALNVDQCVLCGSYNYENINRYSFKYHGVICNSCLTDDTVERSVYIESRIIYLAAFLKYVKIEHLNSIHINFKQGKELFRFVDMLFQEYTGQLFKTRKLIDI